MIGIVSDHGGFELKEKIREKFKDIDWLDIGCHSTDSVDYPDMARTLAESVKEGKISQGIAICGTGIGISIALNRFQFIRAALCHDTHTAEMARKHNDANILALGGRILDEELVYKIIERFFETEFEGGRHARRVEKLSNMG